MAEAGVAAMIHAGADATGPSRFSNEMKEVEAAGLTKASEDESVEVFHLMSPLMIEQLGNVWGEMGYFHSGLGFIHKTAGVHMSAQFYADSFGVKLILPEVDRGSSELRTASGGKLGLHEGKLDFGYWCYNQKVATISGADYNKFVEWCQQETPNYMRYNLFHLRHAGDPVKHPLIQTWSGESGHTVAMTCFDACEAMLELLQDIAGPAAFIVKPTAVFRTDVYRWMKPGTSPRKLDPAPGSEDQEKVFKWLETMTQAFEAYQGLDMVGEFGRQILNTGLDYAIYPDSIGGYWEYTPADDVAASIVFDADELKRVLPLLGHGDAQEVSMPIVADGHAESKLYSTEMKLVEVAEMTRPAEDDDVDFYYIMSPLMLEQAGDAYAHMGNFHSGVAFVHRRTNVQVTVQFYADVFGYPLIIPSVDRENDKLLPSDGAVLGVHEGKIDFAYWRHCQKLATIKGSDYIKFIDWLANEQGNYSKYTLHHLRATGDFVKQPFVQTWSGPSGESNSLTCFDACGNLMQAVKGIAGAEAFEVAPETVFRNDVYCWMKPGTEPIKLDMTPGGLQQQRAFIFYEKLLEALTGCQDLDLITKISQEIGKTGLPYAIFCDATGNFWEYTPDRTAMSIEFDQEKLQQLLPLLGTGHP